MNDGYGIGKTSEGFGLGNYHRFGKALDGSGLGKPLAKEGRDLRVNAEGWDDHTIIDLSVLINK